MVFIYSFLMVWMKFVDDKGTEVASDRLIRRASDALTQRHYLML
jgi:hypothetical protein